MSGWTALILAGQRPGTDALAAHFGEEWKALVPIAGEAMLTRVVRTLHQVPEISRIIVLGQNPEVLADAVAAGGGAAIIASQSGISASISAVAGDEAAPWPVLVTTADHPLLTPAMVSAFLAGAQGADLAVAMVEKQPMLAQFPHSKRTWLKFSDGHWSGANLFALTGNRVRPALALWAAAEQDRKKAWKLFLHFGPWLAIRALTRTIGLSAALERAGRNIGLVAQLVPMADPVAAIDVDKPADHALATEILASRQ
jgi:GTP:adenosylcobinamide-phosphate guanylyltransferase